MIGPRKRNLIVRAALGLVAVLALSVPAAAQDAPAIEPGDVQALLTDPRFSGPDVSVHYVGTAADPDVYVAVVDATDGSISVYLCDGEDVAVWLEGTLTDGAFEATSADGATASGTVDGAAAAGSVTLPDGSTLAFSAPLAVAPAGLYTREFSQDGVPTQSRTIQLPNGTAKGKSKQIKCDNYQTRFEVGMEVVNSDTASAESKQRAGNGAAAAFRLGRALGCAWVNEYLSTT